jgi:uncharacterized membrane protein
MSVASQTPFVPAPVETPFARAMAFAAYFLLLAALPTFGFGALIGLVIAYARRDGSTPLIRSHHRFQIRIFWIGVALATAALALGVSGLVDAWRAPELPPVHIQRAPGAQTIEYRRAPEPLGPIQPVAVYSWSYRTSPPPRRAVLESYAAMVTLAVAGLWSIFAPLWGVARLASGRPIGHSPR